MKNMAICMYFFNASTDMLPIRVKLGRRKIFFVIISIEEFNQFGVS